MANPFTGNAVKCPGCKSYDVRHSRQRREDGPLLSLFYSAYRCRNCRRRFHRLTSKITIGATAAALVVIAVGLGWALRSVREIESADPAPPIVNSPAVAAIDADDIAEPRALPTESGVVQTLAEAAEKGEAKAQHQLGMNYFKGQGVPRDFALAYGWLEKAAVQNHVEAQFALGAMHLSGRGALQNFPAAFKWFERAAQRNHAEAQFALGSMYRKGQGVLMDKSKAYVWYNLAAAQAHDRARETRDSLLSALTPEQVKAAQHESQQWKPTASQP